jgi:hypothetical protein
MPCGSVHSLFSEELAGVYARLHPLQSRLLTLSGTIVPPAG